MVVDRALDVLDLLLTFQFNTRLESFIAKFKTAEVSASTKKSKLRSILVPMLYDDFDPFDTSKSDFGIIFYLTACLFRIFLEVGLLIIASLMFYYSYVCSGGASYKALQGQVLPSTSNSCIFSSFWSKFDRQLSKD